GSVGVIAIPVFEVVVDGNCQGVFLQGDHRLVPSVPDQHFQHSRPMVVTRCGHRPGGHDLPPVSVLIHFGNTNFTSNAIANRTWLHYRVISRAHMHMTESPAYQTSFWT